MVCYSDINCLDEELKKRTCGEEIYDFTFKK